MTENMRPPIDRAMRTLDRAFFQKTVQLSAARVLQNHNISRLRTELCKSGEILQMERVGSLKPDVDMEAAKRGRKCILLRPGIKHDDESTWSDHLSSLIKHEDMSLIPYSLKLDYDHWTYHEIMAAILPQDSIVDLPSGFSMVGHVAHLNLRSQFLPYKSLVAQVLVDKNPNITVVINKVDSVGEESEFRTFSYEVLAGKHDLNVTVREQACVFSFDYAKVYWNPRLQTEHERLVNQFQPGQAICDVMAGIGPFALPAGRKQCFVWANDLNPHSYQALDEGIKRNKVEQFVKPFNHDGFAFIRQATLELYQQEYNAITRKNLARTNGKSSFHESIRTQPKVFSHFVMNLPATALDFLPAFIGLYGHAGVPLHEPLPKIHAYCFNTKSGDNEAERDKICETIGRLLGYGFKPGSSAVSGEMDIYDVRDVAPNKRMFCASFLLPTEVAYRVEIKS